MSFGDSLSDAGSFGYRYTTLPGYVWTQYLAESYGDTQEPNEYGTEMSGQPGTIHGGLGFAEGGAMVNSPNPGAATQSADGMPISAQVQLEHFSAQFGRFSSDEVLTLLIGTNDVFTAFYYNVLPVIQGGGNVSAAIALQLPAIRLAAQDAASIAEQASTLGAQQIVVMNLYDLGDSPYAYTGGETVRSTLSSMTQSFNDELEASLVIGNGVALFDTYSYFKSLIASPAQFGFAHGAGEDACATPGVQFCEPSGYKSSNAAETYIFAGSLHWTTRTNQLVADKIAAIIDDN